MIHNNIKFEFLHNCSFRIVAGTTLLVIVLQGYLFVLSKNKRIAFSDLSRGNGLSGNEELRVDVVQVPAERLALEVLAQGLAVGDVAKVALDINAKFDPILNCNQVNHYIALMEAK